MTNREVFAFLIGLLVGLMLSNAQQPPTPPAGTPRRGKTQPIRIVEKPA